MYVKLLIITAN